METTIPLPNRNRTGTGHALLRCYIASKNHRVHILYAGTFYTTGVCGKFCLRRRWSVHEPVARQRNPLGAVHFARRGGHLYLLAIQTAGRIISPKSAASPHRIRMPSPMPRVPSRGEFVCLMPPPRLLTRPGLRKPEHHLARKNLVFASIRGAKFLEKQKMFLLHGQYLKRLTRLRQFPAAFLPSPALGRNDFHNPFIQNRIERPCRQNFAPFPVN